MFKKLENKNLCEQILKEVAERHKINITELSVMPDHIHMVASIPPTMSISKAFHLLKGASAHALFKEKPNFRKRYPKTHLWSPGKFYRIVGDADLETVINYVKDQRLIQTTLNEQVIGC
jgi:putative transposase